LPPSERIAVVGLGYVGLPVALALAKKFPGTRGLDINAERVAALRSGHDSTGEVAAAELKASKLEFTADVGDLADATFFVVAVPTPIDQNKQPDLRPLLRACQAIGGVLKPGAVVVFESTVYPGVTEDVCGPALAHASGLRQGVDFKLGYSPERINPGDREHTLERITKVVSGEDEHTLGRVAAVYETIIDAGVYRAPSIKVAEAAKVIENTQRDLNIALMNELALIFDRIGISTYEVLAAAGTKWNFLPFRPGLVGGHCIGVDPYYLTAKAEQLGYQPQVILAGRRINDNMGSYVAQRTVKLLAQAGAAIKGGRVGVLGLTFKEDVPDLRNSRVPDIVHELHDFGIEVLVHDPLADGREARQFYGVELVTWDALTDLDALIIAVSHKQYRERPLSGLLATLRNGSGIVVDIKAMLAGQELPAGCRYWSL
jgi:UDP-N-acetyl-D-glucosamine/UDP-N-acetyl-D-galactosamine dehydrogenase